jgi:hypothetical protein
MRSNGVFRMTYDTLKVILTVYASAWAMEVLRYRQEQLSAQNTERAFWFGMSNAFEDSVDELLKLLDKPTVPAMFSFIEVLKQRHTQAEQYHAGLEDQLSLSAYTMGVAEAYQTCVEYMNDVLIEIMLSVNTRVEYLS